MSKQRRDIADMPSVMTVMDVAEVMGISRNSAYDLVHAEGFPKIIVGKMYRIPKVRFEQWLNSAA